MKEPDKLKLCLVAALVFLFLIFALVILPASCEADAYRRLTGKQVTTWDAIWLDFRIQEQVQP